MKKLIPAIGMTLLGAALLGTSTYAWFSANKTVTATGMNLQAKADSSLLISDASNGTFSNTMSFANDVVDAHTFMEPTRAAFNETSGSYSFKALSQSGKAFIKDDGTFVGPADDEETVDVDESKIETYLVDTSVDNYHDDVFLKFEAPTEGSTVPTQDVVFSATLSSQGTEEIYKAFRVSVVDPDTKKELYTFKWTSVSTTGVEEKAQVTPAEGGQATDVKVTLTANTAKKLEVYAWVDGDDPACKNSNAIDGAAYTVMLTFTVPGSNS